LRGFSHQQSLVRLRDAFNFVPTVVYDIGAYHGDWTKATRKVFPAAEYFLFEANPENALILRASGESHFIAALAEKEGMQMKFHLPGDESPATGASLYREKSIHYLRENSRDLAVTTRRLDILAREHQLPSPDLIKLDVQGAELDVLNGAGAALENCSALIIELSLVQGNEGGPLAAEVIAGIDKLGFKCADVCKIRRTVIGSVSQLDLLFVSGTLHDKYTTAAGVLDQ